MPGSHKQWPINTNRKTSVSQSLPSQSGEGKVWDSHAAHDVVDKCKTSRKNWAQQAAHKPCTAIIPSKNHETIRIRSG